MNLYSKLLAAELSAISRLSDVCPVDISRSVVDNMGKALSFRHRKCVRVRRSVLAGVPAELVTPRGSSRRPLILYIHGGGYVLGGMDYARGFASLIADATRCRVCCIDYRLAPEARFPAALDDAFAAYCDLIRRGVPPEKIFICGESAGGGLVFSLALKLKAERCPLPRGIIALSPWSDLTLSGASYADNRRRDPSMSEKRLRFYAESYADDHGDPFVSPLFGGLGGLPPSLILAGGHEIMLSDSVSLHKRLLDHGCRSRLYVAPGMWHVYLMYNIPEARDGFKRINRFIGEIYYEQ